MTKFKVERKTIAAAQLRRIRKRQIMWWLWLIVAFGLGVAVGLSWAGMASNGVKR